MKKALTRIRSGLFYFVFTLLIRPGNFITLSNAIVLRINFY
jgi:hypothetical protein